MISGVYCIYNVANNKRYVGQSIDIEFRERYHFYLLRKNAHFNSHLQSSFNKYGADSFEFRIVEIVPEFLLDQRERDWIAFHKSDKSEFGYNKSSGGNSNKVISEETRRKMSLARKGVKRGPYAYNQKSRLANIGRKHSEESRRNMALSRLGKKRGPYKKGMNND